MANGNKFIKSVSFNLFNAEDAAMLRAIKRRNFSGYVKELIILDLKSKGVISGESESVTAAPEASEQPRRLTAQERLEAIKKGDSQPPR